MADTEFYVVDGAAEEIVEEEEVVVAHSDNLALYIDERELEDIARQVTQQYRDDKDARQDWEQMFEKGFELLGLKLQETSEPFEGACTAVHPLIIENAVKFQSKASQELFPPKGPVKTQIIGKGSSDKEAQAKRVKEFMNYQISEMMPEYFEEFERLLFQLPIFGSAFKKVYYDASSSRPISEFVSVDQFYVPFNSPDLKRADRYTHVIYRSGNDMQREIASDMYRECDLEEPSTQERSDMTGKMNEILGFSANTSSDAQYCLLEQHCYLELEGEFETPVPAPYIVTVDEDSEKVLSIRRNWEEGDPQYIKLEHFIHYKFVPGFGFYGFGYIHFLGNMTLTATAAMRALIDAGQFANLPGGFKARGVRIVGDQDPIAPGEWREVESTGQQLDKSFYALPYKEPSATLYQMLDFVTRAGQKFADTTEQVIADSSNYGPVGTTMALIEQSAKFFTAIHKRLHKSQRDEFRVLARVNYEFLPESMGMDVADGSIEIFKEDFDGRIDVLPVSDPNIPSSTHRFALAQMALQLSSQAPAGTYDIREVHKMILEATNIENADRLMPPAKEPQPQSPMADIISVSLGVPIKAFVEQNHQAHIAFKNSWVNNPQQQQNPSYPNMVPLIQANISEHTLMEYQQQVQAMAGENVNDEFAQVQAAEQLAQMAELAQIGQQQGSVEQQSLNLQKADLELRSQEAQVEATHKAAGIMLDNRKLDIAEQRVQYSVIKDTSALVYKAQKDTEDRKTKLIIEYAKFMAALAKNMNVEFSKDSELFKAFPDAFEEVETNAAGGAIKAKDAESFYGLQDRIMNYAEGGDVEREEAKTEQQNIGSLLRGTGEKPFGMLTEERTRGRAADLEKQLLNNEEFLSADGALAEIEAHERAIDQTGEIDETPNTSVVPLPAPPRPTVPLPAPPKPDIEPVEEVVEELPSTFKTFLRGVAKAENMDLFKAYEENPEALLSELDSGQEIEATGNAPDKIEQAFGQTAGQGATIFDENATTSTAYDQLSNRLKGLIEEISNTKDHRFKNIKEMPESFQFILASVADNIGVTGLKAYEKLEQAMLNGDLSDIHNEMLTKAFKKVDGKKVEDKKYTKGLKKRRDRVFNAVFAGNTDLKEE